MKLGNSCFTVRKACLNNDQVLFELPPDEPKWVTMSDGLGVTTFSFLPCYLFNSTFVHCLEYIIALKGFFKKQPPSHTHIHLEELRNWSIKQLHKTETINLAHTVNFVTNFGQFIVHQLKFMTSQLAQTFHRISSSLWRFMVVHEWTHFQTDLQNFKAMGVRTKIFSLEKGCFKLILSDSSGFLSRFAGISLCSLPIFSHRTFPERWQLSF